MREVDLALGKKNTIRKRNARSFRPKCWLKRTLRIKKGNSQNGIEIRRFKKKTGTANKRNGKSRK